MVIVITSRVLVTLYRDGEAGFYVLLLSLSQYSFNVYKK